MYQNKFHFIRLYLTFFVLSSACSINSPANSNEAIIVNETCLSDSNNTYFVYIPSGVSAKLKLPLLVILDPHGSGEFAARKFILAAEKYKCILVGSNQIRNGYSDYISSIDHLIADVRTKYKVNDQVYLAGFSGGARMALGYSQIKKLNGLLISGAGIGNDAPVNKPVYSITGLADFNLLESVQYILNPQTLPSNLSINITETIHEWPSDEILKSAVEFLMIKNDLDQKTSYIARAERKNLFQEGKAVIDSLLTEEKYMPAYMLCNNYLNLDIEEVNKIFSPVLKDIRNNTKYTNDLKEFHSSLLYEFQNREAYIEAFQKNNKDWWLNEINKLKSESLPSRNYYDSFAQKRIVAFLGIACYSMTKSAVAQKNLSLAEKVLTIYKHLEPENAEMYFYWALYWQESGNNLKTIENLKKAISLGYIDYNKISANFSEEVLNKLSI